MPSKAAGVFGSSEDFRKKYFPVPVGEPESVVRPPTNDASEAGVELAERLLEELSERLQTALSSRPKARARARSS
jgi:hypothetical protein